MQLQLRLQPSTNDRPKQRNVEPKPMLKTDPLVNRPSSPIPVLEVAAVVFEKNQAIIDMKIKPTESDESADDDMKDKDDDIVYPAGVTDRRPYKTVAQYRRMIGKSTDFNAQPLCIGEDQTETTVLGLNSFAEKHGCELIFTDEDHRFDNSIYRAACGIVDLGSLNQRVKDIVAILENGSIDDFNETSIEKALQSFMETLEESIRFIKKFTDASIFDRFLNNTDHQKQFEILNTQLSHIATDLNLGLNINLIFDQHQDMIDRQADLAEISLKLDDIALAMTKQQQELVCHKKDIKDEFQRRFNSFRFNLKQDVLKAQNPVEAKKVEEESKLFLHIPGYDLESEELIGEGAFADVYRGTWLSQHHRVAIKTIRMTYLMDKLRQSVLDEIATMYRIRYDHVLNIYGACIEPNYYALVVEHMSLGSLFDVLHKKKHVLSGTDRWSIALQMTKGVNHLHTMSILHCDIKSLNFLMDYTVNGYLVKISDFGLAKIRQETSRQTAESNKQQGVTGTLQWKAPELFKFGKPSKASDIYSLGIVFWELATGDIPYDEVDEIVIIQCVKAGERLKIPNGVPSNFESIISNSWSHEPSKRPTSQELIQQIISASPNTIETTMM
ncbi:unnamed protein product [Rotaria sp. Silwood1]|nr:unnamed protein product [Rotaria sp. Silwood1]